MKVGAKLRELDRRSDEPPSTSRRGAPPRSAEGRPGQEGGTALTNCGASGPPRRLGWSLPEQPEQDERDDEDVAAVVKKNDSGTGVANPPIREPGRSSLMTVRSAICARLRLQLDLEAAGKRRGERQPRGSTCGRDVAREVVPVQVDLRSATSDFTTSTTRSPLFTVCRTMPPCGAAFTTTMFTTVGFWPRSWSSVSVVSVVVVSVVVSVDDAVVLSSDPQPAIAVAASRHAREHQPSSRSPPSILCCPRGSKWSTGRRSSSGGREPGRMVTSIAASTVIRFDDAREDDTHAGGRGSQTALAHSAETNGRGPTRRARRIFARARGGTPGDVSLERHTATVHESLEVLGERTWQARRAGTLGWERRVHSRRDGREDHPGKGE